MAFEEILEEAGSFGRYQKSLVVGFFLPCFTVFPWFSMHVIFITNIPDHWCYVPAIANTNLSVDTQKKLIGPASSPKCRMYDVDYAKVLKTHRSSIGQHTPTKRCTEGWVYDKKLYDATSTTRWNMVCQYDYYVPLILSSTFIGVFIGTPFFTPLSKRIGMRPTFFLTAVLICISEVGSAISPNFTLFVLLRMLGGSAVSTIQSTTYILVLELVGPKMRARINGISTISWAAGSSTVPFLAWLTRDWVTLCAFNSACAAAFLLYWRCVPESPGWLVSKSRYEEAAEVVKMISRHNGGTAHEDEQLLERIQSLGPACQLFIEEQKKVSSLEFFRYPGLRKRFLIISVCWMFNSVPYFGLMMNTRFLAGDPFLNYFLTALVEIPSHLGTWIIVEYLGRRWSTVLALAMTSVSCSLPVLFQAQKWIAIVATFLAKAACSSAYMTLYIQAPELLPTPLRSAGIVLFSTAGVCGAIVAPYTVYLYKYGAHMPFLVFAVLMAVATACSSFLPETLGKPLPQTVAEAEETEKDWPYFSCVSCSDTPKEDTSWRNEISALRDFSNSNEPDTKRSSDRQIMPKSSPNLRRQSL